MLDGFITGRSIAGVSCGGALLLALAGYGSAHAQDGAATAVLSPLATLPTTEPNPVLGSDDRVHLVYELVLMNVAPETVGIDRVETLDAATDVVLGTLAGHALTQMFRASSGAEGAKLEGGGSGFLFMDVSLPENAVVPAALKHRFRISVADPGGRTANGDRDPAPDSPKEITFITDALQVGPAAVVVAPPLEGSRWVVAGGCCSPYSYHRGAALPIDGTIRVAERFAIDFVQLDEENRINSGPRDRLSSYAYFGTEILSVADGTVVAVVDGLPEQVPGKLPDDANIHTAGGNYVVVDIGGGRFAFYAHMQPGSLRVKAGDEVTTGEVLGLLGNSGNTDAPHLHFHIMDAPSPLVSNGLPFVFTAFSREGRITDEQPLFSGGAVTIETAAPTGARSDQLPLNLDVVRFP